MTRLFLFSLLLFPAFLMAQQAGEMGYEDHSTMPEGLKGDLIREIISVVNSGQDADIRAFIEQKTMGEFQAIAMDEHLHVFQEFHTTTGGVEFHGIRTYTPARPDETVVILKDRIFESWRAVVFELEEASGKISSLYFAGARTPSNVIEPPLNEAKLLEQLTQLLRRLDERDAFSGTLLVAKGEQVLFEAARGEASKRFHVPNKLDTKFNLGSMNKMFTSTAIMQLVDQGKVALEDPLSKYAGEDWMPGVDKSKITIYQLLTHTSGLGSYFNDTYWESSRIRFRELEDYKPLMEGDTLLFEPGERYRYSNTGMFMLGLVIEAASGENYFDYIREHISRPAGMENSDCYEMDRPVENLAIGYVPDPGQLTGWQNNLYMHVLRGGPAGGGFSTVKDLHRFALALQQGKLVSDESREAMWTDQVGEGYGFGFGVEQSAAGKVVGHGGGFPGLNANLDIFLDKGYIVAVMSNHDRGAQPVAGKIYELIGRLKEQ